jgi:hypothetical protein
MKRFLMTFLLLALLMASLIIQSPVIALSTPLAQHQPLLELQSRKAPASTQGTDRKLQSTIGSVTGDGGQTEKKGKTQDRADDGKKVDKITKELITKKNG